MKKLIGLYILAFLMFSGLRVSAEESAIRVINLWNNTNMLINSTSTSMTIDLWGYKPEDFDFSVQISCTNAVTNSGVITLSFELSNDGRTFPRSFNIITGFSETNSPNGDGKTMYFFSTGIARYIRFKLVTTVTNADITVDLCTQ